MKSRPTIGELRQRVYKPQPREIGNWLARRYARPTAVYGTWLAVRLGLSAHAITMASLGTSLVGTVAIATGRREGFVAGVLLLHLGFWLDHVDGQVARWKGTSSLAGVYLDYLMHHALATCLGFSFGFGMAVRTGGVGWTVAGFLAGLGWLFLGIQDDCRYKALFTGLKLGDGSYRVDSGRGERAKAAPGWPREGLGRWSWPLLKWCEPHVVLVASSVLAFLAVADSPIWGAATCGFVAVHGFLAPLLAMGRAARSVRGGVPDREFDRWFRRAPAD